VFEREREGISDGRHRSRAMKLPTGAAARAALVDSAVLAVACLATFLLVNKLMARVHSVSADDDLLGAMWAVLATIFVNRSSYQQSRAAAVSRTAATLISFAYCLVYLAFLPFHTWALPVLVGVSALTATLIGRPGDAVTAAITTAVVLVVAAVSPQGAWEQPILRLVDTVIGVAVGVASAWLDLTVIRPRIPGLPSPGLPSPGLPSPGPPSPGDQGG
jgi:hypothetical protein